MASCPIPHTGEANNGVSCYENTDQIHWHWMGKVHNFLETEFLDEIDLNNDTWIPGYAVSDNGGTSRAEVIYLRRTQEIHKKLIGVIMNRTWNWYTVGEGGECEVNPNDISKLPNYMENLVAIGFGDEPLRIPEMGFLNQYNIEYYESNTLETINFETTIPVDGKLPLVSYPLLTNSRPFVFFKAWRNQEGEQFMPNLEEPAQTGVIRYDQSVDEFQDTQSGLSHAWGEGRKIVIWPNPATESLEMELLGVQGVELMICDALGRTMLQIPAGTRHSLNISTWAPGVYCVYVNSGTFVKSYFIVQ